MKKGLLLLAACSCIAALCSCGSQEEQLRGPVNPYVDYNVVDLNHLADYDYIIYNGYSISISVRDTNAHYEDGFLYINNEKHIVLENGDLIRMSQKGDRVAAYYEYAVAVYKQEKKTD